LVVVEIFVAVRVIVIVYIQRITFATLLTRVFQQFSRASRSFSDDDDDDMNVPAFLSNVS
jgi:hypothetical protein